MDARHFPIPSIENQDVVAFRKPEYVAKVILLVLIEREHDAGT
jgi:hypothetical protein